jgi:hypothetical protein
VAAAGALSDCNTYACTSEDQGAGGGGAGYGTAGTAGGNSTESGAHLGGEAGQTYGTPQLTQLFLGSGGGAGSGGRGGSGTVSTYSGKGGGIVLIAANNIDVAGTVLADGEKGGENNNCLATNGSGSGGGGSGGSVYLAASTISVTGAATAKGGLGGCIHGGNAGVGRIRLDCTICPSAGIDPAPHVGTP